MCVLKFVAIIIVHESVWNDILFHFGAFYFGYLALCVSSVREREKNEIGDFIYVA